MAKANDEDFVEAILRQVGQQPGRPWLIEIHGQARVPVRGRTLTQWVAASRHALKEAGAITGDRVALVASNSARWVAADLAILAEGMTVVPLYARQAEADIEAQLQDADPRVVIVEDETLAEALEAKLPGKVITLETLTARDDLLPQDPAPTTPDATATIIYTSGTSGAAKGVMLTHGNVNVMLQAVAKSLNDLLGDEEHEERIFHYLPFCFAGSRIALWVQLLRGKTLMLSTDLAARQDELKVAQPHYFLNVPMLLERMRRGVYDELGRRSRYAAAWLRRCEAAFAGTPSTRLERRNPKFAAISRRHWLDPWLLRAARRTLLPAVRAALGTNLRFLICGSAPLAPDTQRFFEMLKVPVYQVYGLTETTAITTLDGAGTPKPGYVGKPLPLASLRIAEDGELLIQGPHIFAGYFRKPEATGAALQDGWFHTGDLAEIDDAGRLRVLGRKKHLLILESGHNVPPEPIEEALASELPNAEHVVVVGHGRPYVTALIWGPVASEAADRALTKVNLTLPHYKQVRRYQLIEGQLTDVDGALTANRKLRRAEIERVFADAIAGLYARKAKAA